MQRCIVNRPYAKLCPPPVIIRVDRVNRGPFCAAVLNALAQVQELHATGLAVGFGKFIEIE